MVICALGLINKRPRKSTPRSWKCAISATIAPGSRTTPAPMTQRVPGCKTPDGICERHIFPRLPPRCARHSPHPGSESPSAPAASGDQNLAFSLVTPLQTNNGYDRHNAISMVAEVLNVMRPLRACDRRINVGDNISHGEELFRAFDDVIKHRLVIR